MRFIIWAVVAGIYMVARDWIHATSIWNGVLLMLPVVLIAAFLERSVAQSEQHSKDEALNSPTPGPADGNAPPPRPTELPAELVSGDFVLLLRSFQSEGRLQVKNPELNSGKAMFVPLYSMTLPSTISLDEAIAQVVGGDGKLVAIGGDKNVIGPGKLKVLDEHWLQNFALLSERARYIVVVPGVSPGIQTELRVIASGPLRDKTVILMPPELPGRVPWLPSSTELHAALASNGIAADHPNVDGRALAWDPRAMAWFSTPGVLKWNLLTASLDCAKLRDAIDRRGSPQAAKSS